MSSQPATLEQLMHLMDQVGELTTVVNNQIEALRFISLSLSDAISRQPATDKQLFLKDFEASIEATYGQGDRVPMPVLDIRAHLVRLIAAT